jgi:hypothetical protein
VDSRERVLPEKYLGRIITPVQATREEFIHMPTRQGERKARRINDTS